MKPRARSEGLLSKELDGELLVYDLETHRAVNLNPTAARVFRLCDGTRSLKSIAAALRREPGVPADEDWVRLALAQLGRNRLLHPETAPLERGLSRREIIRRAGRAAGIAVLLPTAISIVAPTPAEAAATCIQEAACDGTNNGTNCYVTDPGTECPIMTCAGVNLCL